MNSLLFATSNEHKILEAEAIFKQYKIGVVSLKDVGMDSLEEPVEDGKTFFENALIKAKYYMKKTGLVVLADDSGLQVDALDGRPGIYSARFAEKGVTRKERDEANNLLLLSLLKDVPFADRTARFVCVFALVFPDRDLVIKSVGTFEGLIGDSLVGRNGFGYDPLFFVNDLGCTAAELSAQEKNMHSHRAMAVRNLVDKIKDNSRKSWPFYSQEPKDETT